RLGDEAASEKAEHALFVGTHSKGVGGCRPVHDGSCFGKPWIARGSVAGFGPERWTLKPSRCGVQTGFAAGSRNEERLFTTPYRLRPTAPRAETLRSMPDPSRRGRFRHLTRCPVRAGSRCG